MHHIFTAQSHHTPPYLYIGKVAEMTGAWRKAIRHYESLGLLPAPQRRGKIHRRRKIDPEIQSGAKEAHMTIDAWTRGFSGLADPPPRPITRYCIAAVLLIVAAGTVNAMSLDEIYGGMAKGCTYDQDANYRIITAYVDETETDAKLARPSGGKRLAPFFGKATLRREGEFYTLTISISDATLYGIPVSRLSPYRGISSGVAGVAVTFPVPIKEVKARLSRTGVKLVPRVHDWGEIAPVLQATEDGLGTELICDLSM